MNEHTSNVVAVAKGTDADSFWAYLRETWKDAAEVLIVSAGAREQAAALGLWDKLMEGEYVVNGYDPLSDRKDSGYVVLESPPTIIRFAQAKGGRMFTWIDPLNFGSHVGTNTAVANDGTDAECNATAVHVREWYATLLTMTHVLKLGTPEHTAASQAAAGYRRSYMDYPIYTHDNEGVLHLERAALFGGRNECRFVGALLAGEQPAGPESAAEAPNWQAGLFDAPSTDDCAAELEQPRAVRTNVGPIYQYDYNSLYPSVAVNALLPTKLRGVIRSPAVSTLLSACATMPVIATVRIQTKVPTVPVWIDSRHDLVCGNTITRRVVKGETDHKRMAFPVGEFNAVLCGPEIRLAAEHGTIVSCGLMAVYDGRPIYKRWVDTFYPARTAWANADVCDIEGAIKSIMNASFSKWAQIRRRWQDEPGELCPWPWDQWWRENAETDELEQWRCFAWRVQRLVQDGEPGDSFPAITAYINSLGRVRLFDAMWACGPGNVFYCDTDSVWTNEEGAGNLNEAECVHQTYLGKMKLVGEYQRVELFGLKRYIADGKLTCAGANGETTRTSDAWALALRPSPAHSFLRMHRPPGIDLRTARIRLALPYRHGFVTPDGSTEPLTIYD